MDVVIHNTRLLTEIGTPTEKPCTHFLFDVSPLKSQSEISNALEVDGDNTATIGISYAGAFLDHKELAKCLRDSADIVEEKFK